MTHLRTMPIQLKKNRSLSWKAGPKQSFCFDTGKLNARTRLLSVKDWKQPWALFCSYPLPICNLWWSVDFHRACLHLYFTKPKACQYFLKFQVSDSMASLTLCIQQNYNPQFKFLNVTHPYYDHKLSHVFWFHQMIVFRTS